MNWKTIKKYPDYMVSDCGQVKSIERHTTRTLAKGTTHPKFICERILKQSMRNGYLYVTVKKNKSTPIHHLVASEFLGDRPSGLVVNHKNGNKLDNRAENLEYCTMSKNTQDYYILAGKSKNKIDVSSLPDIFKRINNGETIKKLSIELGVDRNDLAALYRTISLTGTELNYEL